MLAFPSQKVTESQRKEENYKHSRATIDYYIQKAIDRESGRRQEITSLLNLIDGEIDETAYSHVLNPWNDPDIAAKIKKYPAVLRHYDIITPLLEMWLGEKQDEPDTLQVVVHNPTVESELNHQFNKQIDEKLTNLLELHLGDVEEELKQEALQELQSTVSDYEMTAAEKRAKYGQEIYDFIKYALDLRELMQEAFKYWLALDMIFTYKEPERKDLNYEIIHPLDAFPFMSENSEFVEDGYAFVRRLRWNIHDFVDKFYDEMDDIIIGDVSQTQGKGRNQTKTDKDKIKEDLIKYIETRINNSNRNIGLQSLENERDTRFNGAYQGFILDETIDGFHVVYKSFVRKYLLNYWGMDNELQQKEVDKDYVLNEEAGDINIEVVWVNQVFEGYRFFENIYARLRPALVQRNLISNKSVCKLPYGGRVVKRITNKIYSYIKRGVPHQVIYNIVRWQFEKTLNKNRDKLVVIPKGLVPSGDGINGMDEDKFIYMADSTGFLFFDETKRNAVQALQQVKAIDVSLNNYIKEIYSVLRDLKDDYYQSVGISPQRLSEIKTSAGKGTTREAINRSAIINKEKFRQFDKFYEKEIEGLFDCCKVAYADGIKADYVTSGGYRASIEVEGDKITGTEFGAFARNNSQEKEKLDVAREYAFAMAQNDRSPGLIGEILDSDNFKVVKSILNKMDKAQKELEEANRENERQISENQIAANEKAQQLIADTAIRRAEIAADAAVTVAALRNGEGDGDGIPDAMEILAMLNKERREDAKLGIAKENLALNKKKVNHQIKKGVNK